MNGNNIKYLRYLLAFGFFLLFIRQSEAITYNTVNPMDLKSNISSYVGERLMIEDLFKGMDMKVYVSHQAIGLDLKDYSKFVTFDFQDILIFYLPRQSEDSKKIETLKPGSKVTIYGTLSFGDNKKGLFLVHSIKEGWEKISTEEGYRYKCSTCSRYFTVDRYSDKIFCPYDGAFSSSWIKVQQPFPGGTADVYIPFGVTNNPNQTVSPPGLNSPSAPAVPSIPRIP